MPKTIKEVLTDYSGVTSIEYSDGSTRSYTVDNVATISADGQSLVGAGGVIRVQQIAPSTIARNGWAISNAGLQGIDTYAGISYSSATKYISANIGGTLGRIFFPWLTKTARMSATVKVTKATTGSISLFGLAYSAAGADPGASYTGAEVGYVQGSGLVIYRNNAVDTVLVADSSLVDGAEYDISLFIDDLFTPAASSPAQYQLSVRVLDSTGADVAAAAMSKQRSFDPIRGVLVAKTNVSAGGLKNLCVAQNASCSVGVAGIVYGHSFGTNGAQSDLFFMRLPSKPNGKMVIALHGRGLSLFQMSYLASQYAPVWQDLERQGYTILFPNLGGDTWASDSSLTNLAALKDAICKEFRLDSQVFLFGYSMGGMVATRCIQKQTLGSNAVTGVYYAAPVCDLEAVFSANPSFTEIATIYPTATDRAAANPIKNSMANFAGVPVLFVAATDDATVVKASNADAMNTLLQPITASLVVSTTGGHGSANLFRAVETNGMVTINL